MHRFVADQEFFLEKFQQFATDFEVETHALVEFAEILAKSRVGMAEAIWNYEASSSISPTWFASSFREIFNLSSKRKVA
ncbi:hypothetical protein [Parasphingorhabdus sp.]|jgi:hypothetical protein|uniref:hypothetical protein n=1 Tax=Parasphingorhabdus sp. TaxID=2709688 RepID=UPI0030A0C6E1|nr:hypothetical protein [Sphingomonadales bacterium]